MWKCLSSIKLGDSQCSFCFGFFFFRMKVPLWKKKSCPSNLPTSGMKLVSRALKMKRGQSAFSWYLWMCNKSNYASCNEPEQSCPTNEVSYSTRVGCCSLAGSHAFYVSGYKDSFRTVHSGAHQALTLLLADGSPSISLCCDKQPSV